MVISRKKFKALNLSKRMIYLLANRDFPQWHLEIKNIEKKLRRNAYLKREDLNYGTQTTRNEQSIKKANFFPESPILP